MDINEQVRQDIVAMRARLADAMITQPTNGIASDGPSLMLGALQSLMRSLPKVRPSLRLVLVEPIPIHGQARTHRKKRINKKWRKRYGMRVIGHDRYLGEQVYVDEMTGACYCQSDVVLELALKLSRSVV